MGHQGQILGSSKNSSQNNDENSSDQSSDESSKNSNTHNNMTSIETEQQKKVEKTNEGLRQRGSIRGLRNNSFSSSVYDKDARWKALIEDRPDHP